MFALSDLIRSAARVSQTGFPESESVALVTSRLVLSVIRSLHPSFRVRCQHGVTFGLDKVFRSRSGGLGEWQEVVCKLAYL